MQGHTYIEARNGGSCEGVARDAFQAAVLDLGLHGGEPGLHFFRTETELDRQLDPWSPRMQRAQHEWGVTFFDRDSGAAAVWVNAAIDDPDFMRHVIQHEIAHVAQPRALVGEAAEADAER
jgi:hypothetical protein